MFGLFKNNEEEKPMPDSPEFLELVEKWESFLKKIDGRFEESVVHAEEAVMDNLVESDYDIHPTIRAWHGMKSQLMGLTDKIEDTFENKVKPQMMQYKEDWDLLDEDKKGTDLSESIYYRIDRHERLIEGKLAQAFYDHAIQLLNDDFKCTQCGGKLEVKKDVFRSHYVSCEYCNTVNTFTPNSKVAEIKGFAIDEIARFNSLEEWDAYRNSQQEYNKLRNPSNEEEKKLYTSAFDNREKTERAYWLKYLKERSQLMPEYEDTLEHDLEVKMKHFYEERKRNLDY